MYNKYFTMKKSQLKEAIKNEITSVLLEGMSDKERENRIQHLMRTGAKEKPLRKLAAMGKEDDMHDDPGDIRIDHDYYTENLKEALNPEVVKTLDRFIKAMAKRYGYSEQDAVFAIQAALKQRKFDKPADVPGFEGTMDNLDNALNIREEDEMSDDDKDKAASKEAKKKDSIASISNKLQKLTAKMKKKAKEFKEAEGEAKDKLKDELKDMTVEKKKLEKSL